MSENNTIIELKGLTKRYGYGDTESFALKDFDLTIKRGEFIMIMGPSGCGKTTLLNAIGGIDLTYNGTILINGTNLASLKSDELSDYRLRNIGYVFQNFNLINLELVCYKKNYYE